MVHDAYDNPHDDKGQQNDAAVGNYQFEYHAFSEKRF
jgi:hypothetical protein